MAQAQARYGEHPLFELEQGEITEEEFGRRLEEACPRLRPRRPSRRLLPAPAPQRGDDRLHAPAARPRAADGPVHEQRARVEPLWRAKAPGSTTSSRWWWTRRSWAPASPRRGCRDPLDRLGDGLRFEDCLLVDDIQVNCYGKRSGCRALRGQRPGDRRDRGGARLAEDSHDHRAWRRGPAPLPRLVEAQALPGGPAEQRRRMADSSSRLGRPPRRPARPPSPSSRRTRWALSAVSDSCSGSIAPRLTPLTVSSSRAAVPRTRRSAGPGAARSITLTVGITRSYCRWAAAGRGPRGHRSAGRRTAPAAARRDPLGGGPNVALVEKLEEASTTASRVRSARRLRPSRSAVAAFAVGCEFCSHAATLYTDAVQRRGARDGVREASPFSSFGLLPAPACLGVGSPEVQDYRPGRSKWAATRSWATTWAPRPGQRLDQAHERRRGGRAGAGRQAGADQTADAAPHRFREPRQARRHLRQLHGLRLGLQAPRRRALLRPRRGAPSSCYRAATATGSPPVSLGRSPTSPNHRRTVDTAYIRYKVTWRRRRRPGSSRTGST